MRDEVFSGIAVANAEAFEGLSRRTRWLLRHTAATAAATTDTTATTATTDASRSKK